MFSNPDRTSQNGRPDAHHLILCARSRSNGPDCFFFPGIGFLVVGTKRQRHCHRTHLPSNQETNLTVKCSYVRQGLCRDGLRVHTYESRVAWPRSTVVFNPRREIPAATSKPGHRGCILVSASPHAKLPDGCILSDSSSLSWISAACTHGEEARSAARTGKFPGATPAHHLPYLLSSISSLRTALPARWCRRQPLSSLSLGDGALSLGSLSSSRSGIEAHGDGYHQTVKGSGGIYDLRGHAARRIRRPPCTDSVALHPLTKKQG